MARVIPVRMNEPISAINITPLVDVMLVLLIIMILSVPVATHKIPVDIGPGDNKPSDVVPHRLDIARDGTLAWDGRPIGDSALPGLLSAARKESAQATLHMRTDPDARYDRFDAVLATIKRSGIERLGFLGNQPLPD